MTAILGVPISTEPQKKLLEAVGQAIGQKTPLYITTPNPEIIVEAQKNPRFLEALKHADISLPDGTGLTLTLRLQGKIIPRIRGRDFFEDLLDLADKKGWTVYLLGSTPPSLSNSIERIHQNYPSVQVFGESDIQINRMGEPIDKNQENFVLSNIKKKSPQLLFVAFGHPKQELWSARIRSQLPNTSIMTIGGTLDYYGGTVPSPPLIFSTVGLEWLFRLMTQPKRLKRIVNALVVYPWYIVRALFV